MGRQAYRGSMGIDFGEYAAARIARMPDEELTAKGRALYAEFQRLPRWADDNDRLLTAWGLICEEAAARGLSAAIATLEAGAPEAPVDGVDAVG